ncbi:MAG: AMP-binding protein [Clostridia bacterium]|nr:AMP-binding protein [Clostridia bacterium]
MGLDIKIPKFKFPKFKFKEMENVENINIEKEKEKTEKQKRDKKQYPGTNFKTIKETFYNSMEKYPDNVLIMEKPDHKSPYKEIKYKEFGDDVVNFGTGLTKYLNLEGERIIIISETTYGWYLSYMTILCGAGIAVPLDKELPVNEIENLIKRSRASAVIYSGKKKEQIDKVKDSVPMVKYFIQMGSDDKVKGRDVGLNHVLEEGKKLVNAGDHSFKDIEIDPEEFKLLFFTSGTTSQSKGVMICNRNLAANINACTAYVDLRESDRLFSVLPLHHSYESTIGFLYPFAMGASVVVCEGLKYILPNMKESQPTAILCVPILIENIHKNVNKSIEKSGKSAMVNSMIHVTNAIKTVGIDLKRKVFKEIFDNFGGKLRIIVSAAAPVDPKVGKWVQDIGITFLQGYGLTETAPISALTPDYDPRVGSAGKAVNCAEIKIKNPNEKGEGEVLIKSETLMLGYYEDEEATKEVISEDGWFNSGDVGYLDKDGFLYITGRSKNVIVTQNGKNIYPEEIEGLLKKHPEIKECMVYGKNQEESKELTITARVLPSMPDIQEKLGKDKNITDEEIYEIIWNIIKEVNKSLTSYKAIKKLEIKKDDFEMTTTMKIKRFKEIQKEV